MLLWKEWLRKKKAYDLLFVVMSESDLAFQKNLKKWMWKKSLYAVTFGIVLPKLLNCVIKIVVVLYVTPHFA